MQPNPYEVLRLTSAATLPEILERAKELISITVETDKKLEYRRAAEEIRQHPAARGIHQFWEPLDTNYDDEIIERFCQKHSAPSAELREVQQLKQRFVSQECSPRRLVALVIPNLEEHDDTLPDTGYPLDKVHVPLEPWEVWEQVSLTNDRDESDESRFQFASVSHRHPDKVATCILTNPLA